MPSTRAESASVDDRVADLHAAFADPEVRMIAASIGGDDSLRLLPHLDRELVARDPKIVMGYSDTTTLLTYLLNLGVVAFHGPSVMAGLAQADSYPPSFLQQLRAILFEGHAVEYRPFRVACDGYEPWANPDNARRTKPLVPDGGPRFLAGEGIVRGRLLGGCLEVLDMIRGTRFWPDARAWEGAVIVVEGSEEAPPPSRYRRALRTWAVAGHLERASALLVGRPRDYSDDEKKKLDEELIAALAEAGRADMTLVTNCDFGHTDPQWILPLGCEMEIDVDARALRLAEPAVR
jgi:muramoyltetrapeptide carboxypeptidase LdcA involved in peptidoglycan recycling